MQVGNELDYPVVLDRTISDLDLSPQIETALIDNGVYFIGDLVGRKEKDILNISRISRQGIALLISRMIASGLRFETDVSAWTRPVRIY
jgi:DNA-directed RNA polymerase alpha subunit